MQADPQPLRAVPKTAEPVNPHDLNALRSLAPSFEYVEQVVVAIPVRKPSRSEFFRVHPGADRTFDWHVYEREAVGGNETYWVAPQLLGAVGRLSRAVRLFTCVERHGQPFLWPAKLPNTAQGTSWSSSALAAAEEAKVAWVRLEANTIAKTYDVFKAMGDLGEPTWPEMTLEEMIVLAFGGERTITSADHPVLRDLRGES